MRLDKQDLVYTFGLQTRLHASHIFCAAVLKLVMQLTSAKIVQLYYNLRQASRTLATCRKYHDDGGSSDQDFYNHACKNFAAPSQVIVEQVQHKTTE